MTVAYSPNIVTDGLIMHLDAANSRSYIGSSSVWLSLTGNNSAILTGSPNYTNNNLGEFTFDGVSEYGSVDAVSGINAPIGAHTIDMFVKFGSTPTVRQWLLLLGLTNTGSHQWTYNTNGSLSLGVYGATQISTLTPTPGAWTHLCVALSAYGIYVYQNGILYSSSITSTSLNIPISSSPLSLAKSVNAEAYFAGSIASIKLYNRMLTESEVLQNFNAIKGRYSL